MKDAAEDISGPLGRAPIKITRIETRVARSLYRSPFVISSGTVDTLESVIVSVWDEDERCGVGEVSPMTPYSGQTTAGLRAAIDSVLAPSLIGMPALPGVVHERMDHVLRDGAMAKSAIDIAVYDLMGRSLGVPVSTLLGGRLRSEISLAWVIGIGRIDDIVAEAVAHAKAGFSVIKLKIGRDPRRDHDVVAAVRDALPDTGIRVDANQAYSRAEAIRILRAMERYELELIEQPIAGHDRVGLRAISQALDTPVMADESLQSLADAHELARLGACDVFNIKIVKPGGLYRSLQIAAVAQAAGISLMVGSMPEMGVATLAAAQFAAAAPGYLYPCELIGPLMVERDVVRRPALAVSIASGRLPVPAGPGLGIDEIE